MMTKPTLDALIERFEYLDELRESGETNMYGAAPYLSEEFALPKTEARETVGLWMETFDETPAATRATLALAKEAR